MPRGTKRLTDNEANEYRIIANEIMRLLYLTGHRDQLDILRKYAETALTDCANERVTSG